MIYEKIAKILEDFAKFERRDTSHDVTPSSPPKPCEACTKPHRGGGLCPECIELAAGACRFRAIQLRGKK